MLLSLLKNILSGGLREGGLEFRRMKAILGHTHLAVAMHIHRYLMSISNENYLKFLSVARYLSTAAARLRQSLPVMAMCSTGIRYGTSIGCTSFNQAKHQMTSQLNNFSATNNFFKGRICLRANSLRYTKSNNKQNTIQLYYYWC